VSLARDKPIPYYAGEGTPRGFRAPECARRLLAARLVTAVQGREGSEDDLRGAGGPFIGRE